MTRSTWRGKANSIHTLARRPPAALSRPSLASLTRGHTRRHRRKLSAENSTAWCTQPQGTDLALAHVSPLLSFSLTQEPAPHYATRSRVAPTFVDTHAHNSTHTHTTHVVVDGHDALLAVLGALDRHRLGGGLVDLHRLANGLQLKRRERESGGSGAAGSVQRRKRRGKKERRASGHVRQKQRVTRGAEEERHRVYTQCERAHTHRHTEERGQGKKRKTRERNQGPCDPPRSPAALSSPPPFPQGPPSRGHSSRSTAFESSRAPQGKAGRREDGKRKREREKEGERPCDARASNFQHLTHTHTHTHTLSLSHQHRERYRLPSAAPFTHTQTQTSGQSHRGTRLDPPLSHTPPRLTRFFL